MPSRTILVHLSVEVPTDDSRTAEQIADAILAALAVGTDDESVSGLLIAVPARAEEI